MLHQYLAKSSALNCCNILTAYKPTVHTFPRLLIISTSITVKRLPGTVTQLIQLLKQGEIITEFSINSYPNADRKSLKFRLL